MVLWTLERFISFWSLKRPNPSLSTNTLEAINAVLQLLAEYDCGLFATVISRLVAVFNGMYHILQF